MSSNAVEQYEQRAQDIEKSTVPVFLKLGKVIVWLVYAIVIASLVILTMAFVLRLLGAQTDASFTRWVYRNSESAMRPFRGIFPAKDLGDDSVLDLSLLFGAVMYLLVAIGVDALFYWLRVRLANQQQQAAFARAQADSMRAQFESHQYVTLEASRRRDLEIREAQLREAQIRAEQIRLDQLNNPSTGTAR